MVATCSVERRVRSRHVRGRTLVTGLKARYSVVREGTPSARREETGGSDSSTIRDVFTEAISRIEAALQRSASKGHERHLRVDLDAALRVLETTPHPRHKLDDATKRRVRKILDEIDAEEVADDAVTDASENLDRYVYDVDFGAQ